VSRRRNPLRAAILRGIRHEAWFEQISENSRVAYAGLVPGRHPKVIRRNKRELLDMIVICAQLHRPLPPWVAQTVIDAHYRWRTGRLKSWEDVFGKPFRRKTQKGTFTKSRGLEVWLEVHRLRQNGFPVGQGLFEEAAKNLRIGQKTGESGWSTVRTLYYEQERPLRTERG
jgi:hypothetical protein